MAHHRARLFASVVTAAIFTGGAVVAGCEQKNPDAKYVGKSTPSPAPSAGAAPRIAPAPPGPSAPPAAAPAEQTTPAGVRQTDDTLEVIGVAWTIPRGWSVRPPSNAMRLAELVAPGPSGGAGDAEVVVLYFGPQGAGSVEDNLARWGRQVLAADGSPAPPLEEHFTATDIPVATITVSGAFLSGMPGQPSTPVPDSTLIGAVVDGPRGPIYLKMTGPSDVVASQRDRFLAMLKASRKAG